MLHKLAAKPDIWHELGVDSMRIYSATELDDGGNSDDEYWSPLTQVLNHQQLEDLLLGHYER